jgi:hypothetical protein
MNATFRTFVVPFNWRGALALGSAAVLVLAAGCSRARPASNPPGATEPTPPEQVAPPTMGEMKPAQPSEEPSTPPTPAAPAMPEHAQPAPEPAPAAAEPPHTMPELGTAPPAEVPKSPAAQGLAGSPPQVAASELCESLTRAATMREEDVQGGVAIVLVPKPHETMETVRDDAKKFQQTFSQLGQMPSAPSMEGGMCPLAPLPSTGASAAVSEGPKAIRILITSPDPTQIKSIRKNVREFMKMSGGGKGGAKGAPAGAKPKGGKR